MTAVTALQGKGACPDLVSLELVPMDATVRAHVDRCEFCKIVVDICHGLKGGDDVCESFDPLLAAHADGALNAAGTNLLERHLASCLQCRELADTMAPVDAELIAAAPSVPTLPTIDPGAYKVALEVGRGGMGRVMDAHDRRIGRPVVIKELLDPTSSSLAVRFEREARLTARLQHPGIVPIYEIGKWQDGTPFYAMRKIEGRTLEKAIEVNATLEKRLALLPSVIGACEAIAFAHSQHVIHRDLKPANVMLGTYGETIVIDWGLAKDLASSEADVLDASDSGAGLTGIGQAVGTPAYMPPEQAHAQPTDTRSDVYALGAILYQLLAGKPPYQKPTARETLEEVKRGVPRAVQELAPKSPRALVSIVTKAMERMPEDRYPSAAQLADELNRFQTGQLVAAHDYSRGERIAMFVRRYRGVVTATALALVVLAIGATVSIRNILRSRQEARITARELLLEKGRIEQLAGNNVRALAYLYEAMQQGESGPELDHLLGRAVADLDTTVKPLDCGGDDRYLEVSRDGALLAVACHDRARVWRLKEGALGKTLTVPTTVATLEVPGSDAGFDNLTFSPDGSLIATWGEEGIARLWQLEAMTANPKPPVYRAFPHHQPGAKPSLITFTTFTPDGARIATTGDDGFAQIWNIATGREERSLDGLVGTPQLDASQAVRKLFGRLTSDGKLVTLTYSGAGAMFDITDGKRLGTFQHGSTAVGGEDSPDGKLATTCGQDGTTKVIELATGDQVALEGHSDAVWKCVFDASSRRVLTSSHDGTAKVWEITRDTAGKLKALFVTSVSHGELIWIGRFSPDGSRFVTISPGKNMKVWDSASGTRLATYDSRGKDARFLPDNRLAALRGDGRIQLWAAASSRLSVFAPRGEASLIGATPDGQCVATLTDTVTLWQAQTEKPLDHPPISPPLAYAENRVAAVFVLPDPIDPARSKSGLIVIDSITGKPVAKLLDDALVGPSSLALSANGARVAAMWRTHVEIWDVENATRLVAIPKANRVLLSADGKRAVAWTESDPSALDFELPSQPVLWDVDARGALVTYPSIDARPIGFANDGRRLVMRELVDERARDRWPHKPAVSIWDTERGVRVMLQEKTEIAPTIDPTGRWITTIGTDREVAVWDAVDNTQRWGFSGEAFQTAQADNAGTLLVAIGEYGRAVMVLSAADGRVLARHQLDHDRVQVNFDHFRAPFATAWWTRDNHSIASLSRGFATWNARNNSHSVLQLGQLVKQRVPWRIENGHLKARRNGQIIGVVTRVGVPVAGAEIKVSRRRPADLSDKPVNWVSMRAQEDKTTKTTDARGNFLVEDLVIGEYEYVVNATHGGRTSHVETLADPEEGSISLELP